MAVVLGLVLLLVLSGPALAQQKVVYFNETFPNATNILSTTSTGTTPVQGGWLGFTPPEAQPYMLLGTADVGTSSAARFPVAALTLNGAEQANQTFDSDLANAYFSFGTHMVRNLTASQQWVNITFKGSTAAGTTYLGSQRITAVSLVPGNYYNSSNESGGGFSTSFANITTLTFTPPSAGAYLILASGEVETPTATQNTRARLVVDGYETMRMNFSGTSSSTTALWFPFFFVNASQFTAASHTVLVQGYSTTTATSVRNARLTAIRLTDDFDYFFADNLTQGTGTTSGTPANKVGIQANFNTTGGPFTVLASTDIVNNLDTGAQMRARLTLFGGETSNLTLDAERGGVNYTHVGHRTTALSSPTGQLNITFDRNTGTGGTVWANGSALVALRYTPAPLLSNASWNQSSVSPGEPVRFNVTVTEPGNITSVSMNVSYPNGSAVQRGLARSVYDGAFYTGSGADFQSGARYAIRNSTQSGGPTYFYINVTQDNVSHLISQNDACTGSRVVIGFPFQFFGTVYSDVYVCNDGYLDFLSRSGVYANVPIPSATSPNGIVAPFWDDQCQGTGSDGVFAQTLGSAPDRIFVVRWVLADFVTNCAPTNKYNYEAVLYENTSDIQFNYADVASRGIGLGDNCDTATVGIENQTGDGGIQHSTNTSSCDNSTAVRFYYPNRYTYVEASTSLGGTYTAVNVTAQDESGNRNTSTLSGVTFTSQLADGSVASDPLVWEDHFDNRTGAPGSTWTITEPASPTDWNILDSGWTNSTTGQPAYNVLNVSSATDTAFIAGGPDISNATYEFRARSNTKGTDPWNTLRLLFQFRDNDNYYALIPHSSSTTLELAAEKIGTWNSNLATYAAPQGDNYAYSWRTYKIETTNNPNGSVRIRAYLDGAGPVIDYTDSAGTHLQGRAGLYIDAPTSAAASADVDFVRIMGRGPVINSSTSGDARPPAPGVANAPGAEYCTTTSCIGADGSIRDWVLLGNFSGNAGACGTWGLPALNASESAAVQAWPGLSQGGDSWQRNTDTGDYVVDFGAQSPAMGGSAANVHGFAFTKVYSPTTRNATLRTGSDDGVVAWLNGVEVFNFTSGCRGTAQDSEAVNVTLRQGWNRLLLLVTQNGGAFSFTARFTDDAGNALVTGNGLATSLNDGTVSGGWNTTAQGADITCSDLPGANGSYGRGCDPTAGLQMLYISSTYPGNCPTTFSSYVSSPGTSVTGYRWVCAAAMDIGGNTGYTRLPVEFWVDTAAPTGGSVSYPDGYRTTTSVDVTFSNGTDSDSGISSNQIRSRTATLTSGSCGSFGAWATNATSPPSSPYTVSGLASGQCYQFSQNVTDVAGWWSNYTSASTVKVDTSAPTGTTISYTPGNTSSTSVSITFNNGSDPESGLLRNHITSQEATLSTGQCGAFSPTGTPWNINTTNNSSPYSATGLASGRCYRFAVNVSNNASLWNNVSGSAVQVDTSAPTGGSVTYPNGENTPDQADVTFNNGTDPQSGMDGVSIYRREVARSGPGTCYTFANNWTLRVSNYSTSPWTDTGLVDNTCYQWSHNTSNGAGLWANYTSSNTYINIPSSGPSFTNSSWNQSNVPLNTTVRFNVTIESAGATVTQARINVTYPNTTTIQRSLTNTSVQVGPNRYNWSYNETSTSASGTYTAVNVSAFNGTWNTTTLSGVSFTVGDITPPVISGLSASIDDIGGFIRLHINWTTDETADGFAMVGRDSNLLATRNWTNNSGCCYLVTSHNTTLQDGPGVADDKFNDVDYGAVIYYRARSADSSGNTAWSSVQSITAPACSGTGGGISTSIVGGVFNSTDMYNATHPNANVSATNKGLARALEVTDGVLGDSRTPPAQQMFDGRFLWDAGTQWGAGWAKCERASVLTEVNRTTSNNVANYTAVTHRNLSTNNAMIFDASLLEKIPDLSTAVGTDWVNLTFTSQKDPNRGLVNYTLWRSTDNVTYTRIANITPIANSTQSYNDTGLTYGDKYYRLKVAALGNLESDGFGNITMAHVPDSSPPSGTSITYTAGNNSSTSMWIGFSNETDTESGIFRNHITNQEATLSTGQCGAFSPTGTPWNINTTNNSSPFTATGLASGRCYRFALNVSNGDGYWTNVSGGVVQVDTTAPTGGTVSYLNGTNDTKAVDITFTNATDSQSGVGTNFLDIRETGYNNGTDTCNSFGENWTNRTSGIASPYTVTGLETEKCYQFKMRTRNGAGTNSSDITSTSVVKVVGISVNITRPSAGATLVYAEVPVNVTTTQSIAFIQARIVPNAWTNLTSQCSGNAACNTSFVLNRNGAYTVEVFANSTVDSLGQTSSRAFTLSVPGTPTAAAQETVREIRSGALAISSGGQLKWRLSMNDSNVSTTYGEGGAGALLALEDAYEALGDSGVRSAVNNSSNWLIATNASRTASGGRWWVQFEHPNATAVRSDLPGGALGPVLALFRAYELNGNGSYWNAAKEGLAWLLNNTSVAYNASGSPYTNGGANLSFCLTPTSAACSASAQRATAMTGAAGAVGVVLRANNASGNSTYLNAAQSVANWLVSQAVAVGADQAKWPRAVPPPADGAEYFTGVQEGTAGVVQSLLDLYLATNNTTYLDWAVKGGNWLVARQTASGAWLLIDQGSSCSSASSPGTPCLTGYDYGAAGVLDILLQLYNATRTLYGGDSNSTVAAFKSAAQSAAGWLTQTGSGKAADDVDGNSAIDGSGELRWRYEPATDRFYTGDSGETGGSASIVRALAATYGTLGTDTYRKAAEEGIHRLKNPQACKDADNDYLVNGSGSMRCRDQDSGNEFTSGRNGTAGVLGSMSRIERMLKVTITQPNSSTKGYPSSQPVTVRFNVSKLLDDDSGVRGFSTSDVTFYHDGAAESVPVANFSGGVSDGNYTITTAAKPSAGSHKVWVLVKNDTRKAASPEATYTTGSTHTASAITNRSTVPPGESFTYSVTVVSQAETPITATISNAYNASALTLISPADPPNQTVTLQPGQTSAPVVYTFYVTTNGAYTVTSNVKNGTHTVSTSASVGAASAPSVTSFSNNVTTPSSTAFDVALNTWVQFSGTANQVGNWTWKVDGTVVKTQSSAATSTYDRQFTTRAVFSVTANVSNANGTSSDQTWTVTVPGGPSVTPSPSGNPSDTAGATRVFSATANQTANVTWYVNGTFQYTNFSAPKDTAATYTNTSALVGTWNVSAWVNNSNGTAQQVWTWTVSAPAPQTPSLAIEVVQVNKSTTSDCPTTPCANATGEDFNLSVRVKNNGAAVAPNVYVNRTINSNLAWVNSSQTRPTFQAVPIPLPNAAGDLTQWAVSGAGSNYLAVDDGVSDGNATYVSSTVQNDRDLYHVTNITDDVATVTNVTLIVQALKADVNTVNFNVNLRSGGSNWFSADTPLTNSYANYTFVHETNPTTGQPWTLAQVNDLQVGVQHRQLEVREARVTAIWVRVNYTPTTSMLVGNLNPGQTAWANWTLEFISGANQSHTLPVTAQDNVSTLSDSTSICLVLCAPITLTVTSTTNRTGDSVGLNGYINVTFTVTNNHATRAVDSTNVTAYASASGLLFFRNDSGGTWNSSVITQIAAGGSASRNFTFRAGAYGSYTVNAQATSPSIGSTIFTDTQAVTASGPTLAVTATPNQTAVASNQPFNISVTVTNSGQTAATGVTSNVVLDTCPAGATLVSGTANRSLGNLSAGGGSNSTNYTYRLNSGGSTCIFKAYGNNTSQVGSGDTASALTSSVSSTVLDLVSATPNMTDFAVGQVFRLDVVVTNTNGCTGCTNSTLTGVWTNITLPSGLRMDNGSNTSNVGTLAAGASNTSMFYLVADVAGTYSGASAIQASTTSSNGGSDSGTASSVTARDPTLRVSAMVPDRVARNTVFNYTLVLENTGTGNVNNLTYNVTLPAGVIYAGGDALNGSVGTLSQNQNASYTVRLNVTGAAGSYTLRGYGNATNANGSTSSLVAAESIATGWSVTNLPSSVNSGTPVLLNIRIMNGSNPVNGAVVNVTEYNGVGLFAAPTQARATKATVSGTTSANGYANLTVIPAPSTLVGYSLRVTASGSSNRTPESLLTVNTTPAPRGSSPVFSGEDYWSLFTSLPGEIAAAVSKISYLTGSAASGPAYGGSQATVTLSGVSTVVNATPSTVDNKVPTTVVLRATQAGNPKANLTIRIVETAGHGLLAGAGQSNGTAEISGVTNTNGYANLTITPTRSAWSDWLQARGFAAYNLSLYAGDGAEEKFVMGITVASGSPATAYVLDGSALTSALATEISLLKNKMEWIVP